MPPCVCVCAASASYRCCVCSNCVYLRQFVLEIKLGFYLAGTDFHVKKIARFISLFSCKFF